METKFTEGDWKVIGGGIRNSEYELILKPTQHGSSIFINISTTDAKLIEAAPKLYKALDNLLDDILGLMDESEGVYGLHLNGDVSPWGELDEGGRFERLTSISDAVNVLKQDRGEVV